ncbi:hypothetical protein ElyMa_004465300 [Elysia marginata]|uniref:Uncharacterized protein n=1 Tax=Elysia marginata TaxID=1093978 RepID=A0AAV4HJT0_9GAST|nr:hypothetical protein ElyMa_004465300 [Elysia marginata]
MLGICNQKLFADQRPLPLPVRYEIIPALWPGGKTLAQRSGGVGSIPGRVKPRTLKLVLAADPPSVWHYCYGFCYGFSANSGRPSVRIKWLGVVCASAPYITVWQHALNCPKRRL